MSRLMIIFKLCGNGCDASTRRPKVRDMTGRKGIRHGWNQESGGVGAIERAVRDNLLLFQALLMQSLLQ